MAFADKARENAYKNQFARDKYDRLSLVIPKDEGQEIRAAADAAGQSVNAYILQAVQQRMTADGNSTDNGGKL